MVLAGLPFMAADDRRPRATGAVTIQTDVGDIEARCRRVVLGVVNAGFGPILYYSLIIAWGATRTALSATSHRRSASRLSILLLHEHVDVDDGRRPGARARERLLGQPDRERPSPSAAPSPART